MSKRKAIHLLPQLGKDLAAERGVKAKSEPGKAKPLNQEEALDLVTAHTSAAELINDILEAEREASDLKERLGRWQEQADKARKGLERAKATIAALSPRL